MRTNIEIDDDLLEAAFTVSRSRTKKALIHEALQLMVRLRSRKDLCELAGSIRFHKGYDHKKLRRSK